MASIAANGTTLYYELRGDGPPVMFISGATGDAGHWTEAAEALASDYTVLTYDRRANSRSPRPENWAAAPIDEQADDAAALLRALGLAPAVVFGNSSGAIILTSLALRHPDVLRGAIFHEPPYVAVTSTGGQAAEGLQQIVGDGMARGGPPMAMEQFLRTVVGDDTFEALEPELRARMLANGEIFFSLEMEPVLTCQPSPEQLAQVKLPCVVAAGVENRDQAEANHWMYEASQWLADSLGAPFIETPGAHVPQVTHPRPFAETLRPILGKLSASQRFET